MRSASRISLVLLLLPTLLLAQTKKKPTAPAVFGNARYAWVESVDGDAFRPGLVPEDRQAIADVEDALRAWNRYSLTAQRNEAELLFIVRKGRIASVHVGGTIGTTPYPGQSPAGGSGSSGQGSGGTVRGVNVGGEAGPPDDILEVYMLNSDGSQGTKIWQRSIPDGLNAPQVNLVAELKKAVEKDYPKNPPAKP